MAINKPYFRIARPFANGQWVTGESREYLNDPRYSAGLMDSVRAYHLLEAELSKIFDFVEPTDANLSCFSHEIYALFLRACTEFESNAKAVLLANGYSKASNLDLRDYFKVNAAMRLHEYSITVLPWRGTSRVSRPFESWQNSHSLNWYQAYNDVKHDRAKHFAKASLENATSAVRAVFAILFGQFNLYAFDPIHTISFFEEEEADVWSHSNSSLAVKLPKSWAPADCYEFDWKSLSKDTQPFTQYSF